MSENILEKKFDILKHKYVPKHEILSKEEAEEIFKMFNAKPENFPFILSSDPIVKRLNAKPGDLIKITRISPVAKEAIYYRIVVED